LGVLLAVLPLALAARLALLVTRPLWADELFTTWAARLSMPQLIAALRLDSGPPGFYLLEKPFLAAADAIGVAWGGRVLPFLAGLALIAAAGGLPSVAARRLGAVLLASFALLGLYAAEARAYALLALLSLLLFRLALESEERSGKLAAAFALGAAALYVHYLAIPVVAALFLLALARRRFRTAAALAGSAAVFAPWIPVLAAQPAGAIAWMREPPGAAAIGFLSALGGVGRIPLPFGPPLPAILPALALAAGATLFVALLPAVRRDRNTRDALIFVGGVLGLTLLLSLTAPFAFAGRTEMAVLPVWIWAVARASEQSRALRAGGLAAATLGLLALAVLALDPRSPTAAARAAGAVARLAQPGDALFAGPGLYLPFRLAADRGTLAPRLFAYPAEVAQHPGWWVASAPRPEDDAAVAAATTGSRAVFLLLPPGFVTPELTEILRKRGSVRELSLRPEAVLLHWSPAAAGRAPLGRARPETRPGPPPTSPES
jgi:hypothetical protein